MKTNEHESLSAAREPCYGPGIRVEAHLPGMEPILRSSIVLKGPYVDLKPNVRGDGDISIRRSDFR